MLGFPTSCLLNFYGAGQDNGGRGTDSPGGRHPNRTNGAPTTPPRFLQAGCPSCRPTNSVKALKANTVVTIPWEILIFGFGAILADLLHEQSCLNDFEM